MNEVITELLEYLLDIEEVNEECMQRVFACLSALNECKWFEEDEKENCATLFLFLKDESKFDVFQPLINKIKKRLMIKKKRPWDFDFSDQIKFEIEGEEYSLDNLRRLGIKYVDFDYSKPIHNSCQYSKIRRIYDDGTIEIIDEYNVYKESAIAEDHLFNVYGEKCLNPEEPTDEN